MSKQEITHGKPYIQGYTSTMSINPYGAQEGTEDKRISLATRKIILEGKEDEKIFVARCDFTIERENSTYNGHQLAWALDKYSALELAEWLVIEELNQIKAAGKVAEAKQ